MHEILKDIVFFTIISGRKQKEALLKAVSDHGGRRVSIMYGEGSVKSSSVLDALGFVPEEHKVIITCLLPDKKSDDMINTLTDEFDFDKPNTGIAFSVPLEKLSF
jgi:hypothetical protein